MTEPAELLAAWRQRIAAGLPAVERRVVGELDTCLGDVVDTVVAGQDVVAALRRFHAAPGISSH